MDRQQAYKLIELYVEGWKDNDIDKILTTLNDDCIIIESHGPSFYYDSDVAIFEWNFECVVNNENYKLSGVSVVEFKGDKISEIREYR